MAAPAITPRKAPRQARGRATVAAILEASAHILERDGLEGFNTNAVAERAGVSIGSLYQYFPNKDALVAALSREHAMSFVASLDRASEAAESQGLEANLVGWRGRRWPSS